MKNLKMMTAIMLLLCMALSLCACTAEPATTTTAAKAPAATTTVPATTQQPTEPTSDGKVDYTVTVLYPDGTPVAGAWVQICLAELCYNPVEVNENGVATVRLTQQEGYKTKLLADVAGYTYEVAEDGYVHFAEGSTEIIINLVAVEG